VKAKRVQCDEIWAFTHCKQKNVATAKAAPADTGDVWTWAALDADTKLIVGWLMGGRDAEYANASMKDVAERLATRVQLTMDGHKAYLEAVEALSAPTWIWDVRDIVGLAEAQEAAETHKVRGLYRKLQKAVSRSVTDAPRVYLPIRRGKNDLGEGNRGQRS
jgi:IS1 family transposase